MTEQELRIAKLSKIMNSGQRVNTGNKLAQNEAYDRAIHALERNIEEERQYNQFQEKKKRLLELAEREQEQLRDSICRHHFSVLQQQIEEKKRKRKIEFEEELHEKELAEIDTSPKKQNIKQLLDAQVEEKRSIKRNIKEKEDALDNLRLELARKSLESEMRNKSEGKKKLQNALRESWEQTQNTNKLQKAIERLRRFGDNYVINSEGEEEEYEQDRMGASRKDYEKSKVNGKSGRNSVANSILNRKRSKSLISNATGKSYNEAMEKLKKLSEEEDKIKKQKSELANFLESKSHSKNSSRPLTVTSLFKTK